MLVGAKVCDLTEDLLWFVCGNFDVVPKREKILIGLSTPIPNEHSL